MGSPFWDVVWGFKTTAMFDVWSFEHFVAGISMGRIVQLANRRAFRRFPMSEQIERDWWFHLVGCLCLAYFWESMEHYLESGLAGEAVRYWFQGVEFWGNRLIADPLLVVLGMFASRWRPGLAGPAYAVSMIWLVVHIFVFPHSMYLHEIFDLS